MNRNFIYQRIFMNCISHNILSAEKDKSRFDTIYWKYNLILFYVTIKYIVQEMNNLSKNRKFNINHTSIWMGMLNILYSHQTYSYFLWPKSMFVELKWSVFISLDLKEYTYWYTQLYLVPLCCERSHSLIQ